MEERARETEKQGGKNGQMPESAAHDFLPNLKISENGHFPSQAILSETEANIKS
jgi:hypothetical protein